MANKQSQNQCIPLHDIYGKDNCCLCGSRFENEILRMDIDYLLQFVSPEQREDYFKQYPLLYTKERRKQIESGNIIAPLKQKG
jgi:hypothetical protein